MSKKYKLTFSQIIKVDNYKNGKLPDVSDERIDHIVRDVKRHYEWSESNDPYQDTIEFIEASHRGLLYRQSIQDNNAEEFLKLPIPTRKAVAYTVLSSDAPKSVEILSNSNMYYNLLLLHKYTKNGALHRNVISRYKKAASEHKELIESILLHGMTDFTGTDNIKPRDIKDNLVSIHNVIVYDLPYKAISDRLNGLDINTTPDTIKLFIHTVNEKIRRDHTNKSTAFINHDLWAGFFSANNVSIAKAVFEEFKLLDVALYGVPKQRATLFNYRGTDANYVETISITDYKLARKVGKIKHNIGNFFGYDVALAYDALISIDKEKNITTGGSIIDRLNNRNELNEKYKSAKNKIADIERLYKMMSYGDAVSKDEVIGFAGGIIKETEKALAEDTFTYTGGLDRYNEHAAKEQMNLFEAMTGIKTNAA
jgi:hypothetical protein